MQAQQTGPRTKNRGRRDEEHASRPPEPEETSLLSGQNRVLSRIAQGCTVPDLMFEVAGFVEDAVPGASSAVHLIDPASNRLTAGVSRSLPQSLLNGLQRLPLTEPWPVGTSITRGGPVQEGLKDGVAWFAPFRELVDEHELPFAGAAPAVASRGACVAVVTVFATAELAAQNPSLDEVLDIASSLLGMGVERLRLIERLLLAQTSIDGSRDPVVCIREDASLLYVNEAFSRLVGLDRSELLEMRVYDLDARFEEKHFRRLWKASASRGSLKIETELHRGNREPLPVEVTLNFVRVRDEGYQCALIRNISLQKQTEERLRDCEERYTLAARGANDGLWDWHLGGDRLHLSPRWCALLGLGQRELRVGPDEWWSRIHPEDRERVRGELEAHLHGETSVFESEHRMVHTDGRYLWVRSRAEAVRNAEGKATRLAGSLTDITGQKQAEERLRHDALHDDLTGLPNRALFMDHLGRLLERSKRSTTDYRFAVLFLDFDRFKRINDSLGHLAGDQLLLAAGRRLGTCVRPGDTVARLGGDEFAILLERVGDVDDATRVAERVHQALREPFRLSGMEVFVTASIGIALGSPGYESPEEVLRDADTAMYRAKAAGKARHEVFDEAMNAEAIEQLKLEAELRRAITRGEFRLLYQPVVSLEGETTVGLEALTRWEHPTRGLLAPAAFLGAAEESGLIVTIGWWVFREACRQMKLWQTRDPSSNRLAIHVNLSDKQLFEPELPGRIEETLRETDLAPQYLVLDIPENVIMQKAESSVTILSQLKSLGLRIHLDDFGTGYSSLGYLHRFQIDALKIDRSFIRHLRPGGDNWITVRTIVSLAQNLGMDVIAEGVESDEQRVELLNLGCRHGQGSLFYNPLSIAALEAMLRTSEG